MASDSDKPEAVAMVCGPGEGERYAYQCRSCGVESDDIEDFNMSTCWGCCERANWGDLCQLERHGECVHGDPDDPEFCPCPCHDEDFKVPASPFPPRGDAGLGGDEVPPCLSPAPGADPRPARGAVPGAAPAPGMAARPLSGLSPSPEGGRAHERGQAGPHLSEAPARRSPRGVARGGSAAVPSASPGGTAAPEAPVPSVGAGGTGAGEQVAKPPSRTAPGALWGAPGATAGALSREAGAPAPKAPSPSQTPDPQGGPDGEGLDPASDGKALSALAGHAPAGGDGTADAAPLAGQAWRDKVKAAQSANAKAKRNQRGKPWTARKATRAAAPGMTRRMPRGKPGGEAS